MQMKQSGYHSMIMCKDNSVASHCLHRIVMHLTQLIYADNMQITLLLQITSL